MTPATDQQLKIENRITTLEDNYEEIKHEISEIRNNHLVHLDRKINWILALIVVNALLGIQVDIKQLITFFQ